MTLQAADIAVRLGSRDVVRGMSIDVQPGEIIGVAGPNGAGKSTLLKALAGLVPLQGGNVLIGGVPLSLFDRRELGRSIAYLPQDRIVHWPLTVETIVALGRTPHHALPGNTSEADRTAVSAALSAMDIEQYKKRPVTELSGGERARVLIARALAQDARFLIADEPAAGLDPAHTLTLFEHLSKIASDGRAVVVALHDLSLALRYCSRLALIKNGHLVACGATGDVLSEANISAVYGVRAKLVCAEGVSAVLPISRLT